MMASLLRALIASPRIKHAESALDLCYVTPFLIATSGPSSTYPQRAYRNPLDQLVSYLDTTHSDQWCIWEFRAEGTGYPDAEVAGRVMHYPWPDHHPPPFAVVPKALGSMRIWLDGGRLGGIEPNAEAGDGHNDLKTNGEGNGKRVVIFHCKAGKGRTGTMACSYLISQCGWKMEDALARFTERRMRPGFGQGVSIPSQLRYIGYVDRWTKGGKKYVEKKVEIVEIHVWGLRAGVKVAVEGYVEEGKVIHNYHTYGKKERLVVEGDAPGGKGVADMFTDMAGYGSANTPASVANRAATMDENTGSKIEASRRKATGTLGTNTHLKKSSGSDDEAGGGAVMFKSSRPIIIAGSDINIDFERRTRAGAGLTMVTSVAHVWFNVFFEGNGPEQNGEADQTGIFEMDWDKMDGIKGSARKGTRAFDRMAVVWRTHDVSISSSGGVDIRESGTTSSPVNDMAPADWKQGAPQETSNTTRYLGLRRESPDSVDISKTSSLLSSASMTDTNTGEKSEDDDSLRGLKTTPINGCESFTTQSDVKSEKNRVDAGRSRATPDDRTTFADLVGGIASMSKIEPRAAR